MLVEDGTLRRDQLRTCGLTENDVLSNGDLSGIPWERRGADLVILGLREVAGFDDARG